MNRTIHRLAAGICLAGLLPALATAAPATKGIRAGAFTLSPFAGLSGTYDSNADGCAVSATGTVSPLTPVNTSAT